MRDRLHAIADAKHWQSCLDDPQHSQAGFADRARPGVDEWQSSPQERKTPGPTVLICVAANLLDRHPYLPGHQVEGYDRALQRPTAAANVERGTHRTRHPHSVDLDDVFVVERAAPVHDAVSRSEM
jgi:hypothetical protein